MDHTVIFDRDITPDLDAEKVTSDDSTRPHVGFFSNFHVTYYVRCFTHKSGFSYLWCLAVETFNHFTKLI
jgi:hypothetical protein